MAKDKHIKEQLHLYIDNCIDLKEEEQVKSHLALCKECREYLEEIKQLKQIAGTMPSPVVSEELYSEIFSKLDESGPVKDRLSISPFFSRFAIAGAIAVLIAVYLFKKGAHRMEEIGRPKENLMARLPAEAEEMQDKTAKEEARKPARSARPEVITPQKKTEIAKAVVSIKTKAEKYQQARIDESVAQGVMEDMVSRGATVSEAKEIVTRSVSGNIGDKEIDTASRYLAPAFPEAPSSGVEITEIGPNPFTPNGDNINDRINFKYTAPADLKVKLSVYDLSGNKIFAIEKVSGEEVYWEGKNDRDDLQEGGLYMYVLEIGAERTKGTIVLAK
ncbi:MAG TPA: gliding motility-associated C-terminal domain-containing protein [bacterium]|nr:gliding motility-associated C-terminal domain-containing protein [bacterium]